MKSGSIVLIFAVMLLAACIGPERTEPADLVLRGCKVATVDADFSIHEAIAVKGDKIIFVGSNKDIDQYISPETKVIELEGKLVLPGLIDSHAHLHSLGEELTYLNITGTTSFSQIIDIVAERIKTAEPGEWIIGGRWDQNDWEDKTFPIHDALSKVSPDNPVYLGRIDGNSAFVNRKALEISGITRDTQDPFGGVVLRKPNEEPSGVLINRAMNIVLKHKPGNVYSGRRSGFIF